MKKNIYTFLISLSLVTVALAPVIVFAAYQPSVIEVDPGGNFEQNSGLGDANPGEVTAGVINWVLGLLGLLAIVLVVYAGFLWMLAAGNEEQVKKAKDILSGAFFGILIILASYGITSYVFENLVNAVENGPQN
ncbi:MAG: hypothetical protein ACD_21C00164G0003 [uncultured bacterium]|nr:MAG: hypothetical protein ACD_21C00164G0003 [uncultured bacterium]